MKHILDINVDLIFGGGQCKCASGADHKNQFLFHANYFLVVDEYACANKCCYTAYMYAKGYSYKEYPDYRPKEEFCS